MASKGGSGKGGSSSRGSSGGGKSNPPRKVYDVSQRPDDKWQGKARGGERPSVVRDTKEQAVKDTTRIARNQDPSQVVIRKADGKIQEERTYGKDPFPPKG